MKITINHLGPIIKAEIDLKPLTIFVGPNNMGKTWLAYSIANIFSPYNFESYIKEYLSKDEEDSSPEIYPLLEEAMKQISHNGMTTIDMVSFANQYAEIYFNAMARMLKRNMPQFMATELASFSDLDISIDLGDMKQKILEQILAAPVRTEISGSQNKPLSIKKKSENVDQTNRRHFFRRIRHPSARNLCQMEFAHHLNNCKPFRGSLNTLLDRWMLFLNRSPELH
ncbi:MAG: hypothetical protein H0V70_10830, partial [Ktedonobacteraceae bacterium]|nr:hypothetical protein [Ktedonobacteraceae bacterium]